jgi:hypothetical protein
MSASSAEPPGRCARSSRISRRYVDPIRAKHPRYFADGGKFAVPLPTLTFIDRAD